MKTMFKKIVSVFLTMAIVLGFAECLLPQSSAVNDTEQDVSYNATNMLGEAVLGALDEIEEDCYITDVEIDGNTAFVEVNSPADATIVVAIYNEETDAMITSGNAQVVTGDSTVEISLGEENFPTFFVVRAFLLGVDNVPLCEKYEDLTYSKAFQDFLEADVNDFDYEQVINLDDATDNNFAVVSDDAKIIDKSEGSNKVVTDDYKNGTYVITNANDDVKSLKPGDVFYYVYGDNAEDYILTKVGGIEIDGDTLTIKASDDFEISDLFGYIKIDTTKDDNKVETQGTFTTSDEEIDKDIYIPEKNGVYPIEVTPPPYEEDNVSASFIGTLKIDVCFQFYYDIRLNGEKDYFYSKWKTTSTFTGKVEIEVEGKCESKPFVIAEGKLLICTGVVANVTVSMEFKVSAKMTINGQMVFTIVNGCEKGTDVSERDLSEDPEIELKFEVEGEAGVHFIPKFAIGLEALKVVKLESNVEADFEISLSAKMIDESTNNVINPQRIHSCALCIDGDIKVTISINLILDIGLSDDEDERIKLLEIKLFETEIELGDFYISFLSLDNGELEFLEFGWGKCPHIKHRVTFVVYDENNNPLEGVTISCGKDSSLKTDANGTATSYYNTAEHTYTATLEGYKINTALMPNEPLMFVVNEEIQTVKIYMKKVSDDGNLDDETQDDNGGSNSDKTQIGNGVCGENLTWSLDSDGELIISGYGEMLDWSSDTYPPWYSNRSDIKKIKITEGVTNVGDCAFYDCGNLEEVFLPNGIETIGDYAFYWCEYLVNISLPNSVTCISDYAFYICQRLNDLSLPNGLTNIGEKAFYGCVMLNSVLIPASVESIGEGAFSSCQRLTNIRVDSANKFYSNDEYGVLFDKSKTKLIQFPNGNESAVYMIPDIVSEIGDYAFYYCLNLIEITIPESVGVVGEGAFSWCEKLCDITLPDTAITIKEDAFSETRFYRTLANWKNDILYIGNHLIKAKYKLDYYSENIIVKEGTITIADSAFRFIKLFSVSLPDSLKLIGNKAFEASRINSVIIPGSVISIGEWAFASCHYLYELIISNGVINVNDYAFCGCGLLTTIEIPDSVVYIGEAAFFNCDDIENIVIGRGVKSIGSRAFLKCSSLKTVSYKGSLSMWCNIYLENEFSMPQYHAENFYVDGNLLEGKLIIPDDVTVIGQYVFAKCDKITSVLIFDKVSSIGIGAFKDCSNLEDLYYTGTEEEWNSIEIGYYNQDLTFANIHYSYSVVDTQSCSTVTCSDVNNILDNYTSKIFVASVDNTIVGNEYLILALKQEKINFLSDNLLYIGQQTATSSEITFDFIPKSEDFVMVVIVGIFADGTKIENAEVDSKEEPELFVAKWIVDGAESAQIYEIGEAIVKPSNPAKDGYKFVGWTPAVPETMPAYDLTFTAVFEKSYICPDCGNEILGEDAINEHIVAENAAKIKPTIKVKNNNGAKTINYGETLQLTAIVTNKPADATVVWYVDGAEAGEGETFNVSFESGTKTVEVKLVDTNGNVLKDSNGNEISDSERVTVKGGFFQKIISFFKNLFGMNRTVIQAIFKGII